MLRTTTFNRNLWQLNSFESISYDKENLLLYIHCFDGITLQFHSITEDILFALILEKQKEKFIDERLKPNHLCEKINA
ncbi:KTSC domain-containing protein [Gracilibacillus ureilyticus]|uniref:KTSC domain-containing protein n=1 Tax=Gracilibacillus ureilyticus TaxID=531814 RepID=A0A1H9RKA2_9BACI|nr:KTSC domain-containing protein [Gracilibacillus ureilyticus]SER73192.1 KTSC domain-containing protein [Gracilibacillus ureilyticus]